MNRDNNVDQLRVRDFISGSGRGIFSPEKFNDATKEEITELLLNHYEIYQGEVLRVPNQTRMRYVKKKVGLDFD